MILEAFAKYLHTADSSICATDILARWLWERLSIPPETVVDQVLHCEVKQALINKMPNSEPGFTLTDKPTIKTSTYLFKGSSDSGEKLLKSLYEYSLSYEQQKWSRFVHTLKASDFNYNLDTR